MAAQLAIAREVSQRFVGRELRVLVESEVAKGAPDNSAVSSWEHGLIRSSNAPGDAGEKGGRVWIARSEADAPDIDGRVYVRGRVKPGEFARVRIVGHTDYDLMAESIS
jgi:ribosomal protein S12 methylthiotransferase